MNTRKRRILFLDRDGTLIIEPEDFQIDSLEKLELVDAVMRRDPEGPWRYCAAGRSGPGCGTGGAGDDGARRSGRAIVQCAGAELGADA